MQFARTLGTFSFRPFAAGGAIETAVLPGRQNSIDLSWFDRVRTRFRSEMGSCFEKGPL